MWQPQVQAYDVADAATGKPLGRFYLDLFPRPGKYDHFANFPIIPRRVMPDGSVRLAEGAVVGNWPQPAPGKAALLQHGDVEVFFHEFGHNMALMLANEPYETLTNGFRQDFIEAPSQMLENWAWDPAILKRVSANVTTGQPLPDALIQKMIAARYVHYALQTTQQILYATVDMHYHTAKPPVDTTAVWAATVAQTTPNQYVAGTHPQSEFGHLMGGYDAGYYGYLWSKVYAQDMFSRFKAQGLTSPVAGMAYRNDILAPARLHRARPGSARVPRPPDEPERVLPASSGSRRRARGLLRLRFATARRYRSIFCRPSRLLRASEVLRSRKRASVAPGGGCRRHCSTLFAEVDGLVYRLRPRTRADAAR